MTINKTKQGQNQADAILRSHGYNPDDFLSIEDSEKIHTHKNPRTSGARIKNLRLCGQFTQAELAEMLDASISYVRDIENGRRLLTLTQATEMAKILGYPEQYFVEMILQEQIVRAGLRWKIKVA